MTESKHYFDEVERLVDEELEKKSAARIARRKRRDWFSISNAGFCMRAAILNRLNAKETPKTDKERRTFFIGDLIHEGFQSLIKNAGQCVTAEEFISSGYGPDASDRVGVLDIIVRKKSDGKHILYEMKSIGSGGFWKMVLKTKAPHKHHVYQAVTYKLENDKTNKFKIDEVKIIYFSKQDGSIRAWPIKVTPELIAEVEAWWDLLRSYWNRKELPAPYEKDSEEYKEYYCATCSFSAHYCFGEPDIVRQNLVELVWENPQPTLASTDAGVKSSTIPT